MELLEKVKETINKYSMLSVGDCVIVGLSGGPDSVCLAVILDKLKKEFNLSLFFLPSFSEDSASPCPIPISSR